MWFLTIWLWPKYDVKWININSSACVSASCAFAALDTVSSGFLSSLVESVVKDRGWHNVAKSMLEMRKIEFLVHLFFESLVIDSDFLLGVFVSPFKSFESISFG